MCLISWSEASLARNVRRLDPFQRARNLSLATTARAIRFHVSIESAINHQLGGVSWER